MHASGFDLTEREGFRVIVYSNITLAMQILFEVVEQLSIPLEHPSNAVTVSSNYIIKCVELTLFFFH